MEEGAVYCILGSRLDNILVILTFSEPGDPLEMNQDHFQDHFPQRVSVRLFWSRPGVITMFTSAQLNHTKRESKTEFTINRTEKKLHCSLTDGLMTAAWQGVSSGFYEVQGLLCWQTRWRHWRSHQDKILLSYLVYLRIFLSSPMVLYAAFSVLDSVFCSIFSIWRCCSFQFGHYLCLGCVFILILLVIEFFLSSYVPHT